MALLSLVQGSVDCSVIGFWRLFGPPGDLPTALNKPIRI
jgi:hypothetical protein